MYVCSSSRGHDASQITLALGTAASYPRACQALGAMLSKGALNPADITVLFKMFTSMDPPPVELVSSYLFITSDTSVALRNMRSCCAKCPFGTKQKLALGLIPL